MTIFESMNKKMVISPKKDFNTDLFWYQNHGRSVSFPPTFRYFPGLHVQKKLGYEHVHEHVHKSMIFCTCS